MGKTVWIVGVIVLALVIGGMFLYKSQPTPNGGGSKASESYFQISGASILNGKLVFIGTTSTGKEVVVYDGKEYGEEYDKVYKPLWIGGKLVYSAYNKDGSETVYYIVQEDKIFTDTDSYYSVSYPVDINGKIAFEAYTGGTKAESNGKSIIIYDGKRYGEQYAWASEIFNSNGKLGYIAKEGLGVGKTFLVIDDKEIGREYNNVNSPTMINGKLAYIGTTSTGKKVVVYDGKESDVSIINGGYRDVSIVDVNGKPAFVSGERKDSFVYYDGKEWKPNKQRTNDSSFTPVYYSIKDIGGKLAFEVRYGFCCPVMGDNPSVEGFVYFDGGEYGLDYDSARSPFEVNGKLGYIVKNNGKEFIVIDGSKATEEYDSISYANEINGRLIYVAKRGTSFSVYEQ